ncbi:predicted protein [Naegleria gruberi]|uniref:Predicted protein n=1 Tax=Naegleria gruberi TaxID=5762 RepID=D2W378_NAEGR|nr:uncharacterized protein NAEGRDRAFT_75848 [Naegleria gruberi]EFC36441.1 predicted protein [Naegleria gruberi]|eukprot:XP_002669185.1 predicted protein [Naegleria gruberi strain NEG-M]
MSSSPFGIHKTDKSSSATPPTTINNSVPPPPPNNIVNNNNNTTLPNWRQQQLTKKEESKSVAVGCSLPNVPPPPPSIGSGYQIPPKNVTTSQLTSSSKSTTQPIVPPPPPGIVNNHSMNQQPNWRQQQQIKKEESNRSVTNATQQLPNVPPPPGNSVTQNLQQPNWRQQQQAMNTKKENITIPPPIPSSTTTVKLPTSTAPPTSSTTVTSSHAVTVGSGGIVVPPPPPGNFVAITHQANVRKPIINTYIPPVVVSTEETLEFYKELCDKIPEKRIGPGFKDIPEPKFNCKKHTNTGDSELELSIEDSDPNYVVIPSQFQYDSGLGFSFAFSVRIHNPKPYYIFVREVQVFYKDMTGKWIEANFPSYQTLGINFHHDDKLKVEGMEKLWCHFTANFTPIPKLSQVIWGTSYSYITHPSLPQPLTLKLIIHDSLEKTKELLVEQVNVIFPKKRNNRYIEILNEISTFKKGTKYGIETVESFYKIVFCEDMYYGDAKFISFGFQDHEEREENRDKIPTSIEISCGSMSESSNYSETQYIQIDFIEKLEQQAKKENLSEIPYAHFGVVFLFDSKGLMYGARVKIESTSQTVEKIVLLRDLIKVLKLDKQTIKKRFIY